ncbi:MAG: UDP-N-acetylmuramoyl-tripeptide--D-alanyl-D-alanine ligase [Betaproteobacteria bacterium]|nr:UDP-N-acetylmuramoyl-tripeptide--D-alanyl-D-alanine ligase [Betaproteobacteria bacterium]
MFELREAQGWIAGARLAGDGATRITAVCTDSRRITPGSLFVALRGERFDAHDFLAQAFQAGAAAVLAERLPAGVDGPALLVADTRRAYGELGAAWRARFRLPLIAVTGSNGKTTVKEMIAAILAARYGAERRLATRGNLNNEIGVPATLLELGPQHQAAVVELGMNHPGEIAWIAGLAAPGVALVNNAQREHQEFLGTVRATAIENGAAIAALPPDGVAVFPGDDEHTALWREIAGARRCLSFGLSPGCDVRADPAAQPEGFALHIGGASVSVSLAIAGAHNVRNALAAAACASAIGIDPAGIAAGLAAFRPVSGRLARIDCPGGARLIDDTYNANPDSVRAAIDVLAAASRPRVLVLGDMGEVGAQGEQFHREVVGYAASRGIDHLLALGEATGRAVREAGVRGFEAFAGLEALLARLAPLAVAPATVLVKGSRSMRMERVVAALSGAPQPAGAH